MQLDIYQVDAFASQVFKGNPAAVVPLDDWLDEATMQAIAQENNLSETAFIVAGEGGWTIRWFTPTDEVDLCGHATLAAAHVIRGHLSPGLERIRLHSPRSGPLSVRCMEDRLELDFPTQELQAVDVGPALVRALGVEPLEAYRSLYAMVVLEDEEAVRRCTPNLVLLEQIDRAFVVTAPGEECDFVSRFFGPGYGVPEDPVTGSAHCMLTPYWSRRLGRPRLLARQLSRRGGELVCEDRGERTAISGQTVEYLRGTITLP